MKHLSEIKVNDDFMDTLRARILADRNAKILASQTNGYSWRRVPAFTYVLSSLMVLVIVGFTWRQMADNAAPAPQIPLATQEKIDDAKKFQQQFDATPAYLQNDRLANTQADSMVDDKNNSVRDFERNLNKVGYQKK